MQSPDEQLAYLLRGVEHVVPEDELADRLAEDRPLRVKLGVDPTAPDVHLGWAVVLGLLRRFQDLGHTAVLIVGDFTARVGDPSGKSETRERLEAGVVESFAATCVDTIREVLAPDHLEVRHNSEWLGALDMAGVLELAAEFTVARMLEREDFASRYRDGKPISLIEFVYPLLQAMDSVAVEADIELGGSDQLWNLLVGRDLQGRRGMRPQTAITVPLLVGTDGERKMSQSFGNYISVKEDPAEMFGKVMSIPDEAMADYYLLATALPVAEVVMITRMLAEGSLHPGEGKRRLGREIVARYHGEGAAQAAEAAFDRVFKRHEAPEEMIEVDLGAGSDPVWLPGLLTAAGLSTSNSESRRLLEQGAVRIDGTVESRLEVPVAELDGKVMQVGKRRFARLRHGG